MRLRIVGLTARGKGGITDPTIYFKLSIQIVLPAIIYSTVYISTLIVLRYNSPVMRSRNCETLTSRGIDEGAVPDVCRKEEPVRTPNTACFLGPVHRKT